MTYLPQLAISIYMLLIVVHAFRESRGTHWLLIGAGCLLLIINFITRQFVLSSTEEFLSMTLIPSLALALFAWGLSIVTIYPKRFIKHTESAVGVITMNSSGVVSAIDGRALSILACQSDRVVGHPLKNFVTARWDELLAYFMSSGQGFDTTVEALRCDGQRVKLSVSWLATEGDRLVITIRKLKAVRNA